MAEENPGVRGGAPGSVGGSTGVVRWEDSQLDCFKQGFVQRLCVILHPSDAGCRIEPKATSRSKVFHVFVFKVKVACEDAVEAGI
jgi:hypothetical protein